MWKSQLLLIWCFSVLSNDALQKILSDITGDIFLKKPSTSWKFSFMMFKILIVDKQFLHYLSMIVLKWTWEIKWIFFFQLSTTIMLVDMPVHLLDTWKKYACMFWKYFSLQTVFLVVATVKYCMELEGWGFVLYLRKYYLRKISNWPI